MALVFSSARQRFYEWRQLRPLQRLAAAGLFVIAWPVRSLLWRVSSKASQPKRILVIQLAGLGDALMATPAIAALHDHYPSAKIDLITLHGYVRDAFRNHPRFNTITKLPAYPGNWIISRFANASSAKIIIAALRCYPELLLNSLFRRYDIGINFALSDFDRNLGNALLYCLGVPMRVGDIGNNDSLLNNPVQINYEQPRTSAYLQLLEPLGIVANTRDYEFPVQQADLESVKRAMRTASIDRRLPLAVIQPGGKMHVNSRRWPAEYFVRVCEFLSGEGFEVVLTGDAGDTDVCNQIARALGTKVKSLAGRLTFSESAALLSLSALCVTNDTSTLHLAEAMKVPRVISIFGPTDAAILAPHNSRNIVFKSELPCAPCMGGLIDGNTELCWRDIKEECLWSIKPDQVIALLKQLYKSAPARVASA